MSTEGTPEKEGDASLESHESGSVSNSNHGYPEVQADVRQFTFRAVFTGMLLGGMLSLCNVYLGLKIGWGFNMSITAALLGFAFWHLSTSIFKTTPFGVLENNMNQTAASAAASISSAGLVAPIPALTMLTDYEWTYTILVIWTLSVSLVGIVAAIGLRKQMLIVDELPFPGGLATGETLREIYAKGAEALSRVKMLLGGMALGAGSKIANLVFGISKATIPGAISVKSGGLMAGKGFSSISLKNLGFALDPSLMMISVGTIIGFRACASMLIGAIVSWLIVGPEVLEQGWAMPGKNDPSALWFGSMVKWMLWPGVAMMVTAALTSFSFSWRSMLRAFTGSKDQTQAEDPGAAHDVSKKVFLLATSGALLLSVFLQASFFDVGLLVATVGVLLTFALAIVAGRVSGETGITPVGPMGKVTQLGLGAIDPGNAASNLMAANVTGGAASQCADMLHDLKSGLMLGAVPRLQILSQCFGVIAGAFFGSAAYLVLIPDPKNMLLTEEWAAPAVAQWKAVAEVFSEGLSAMPQGALDAFLVAGALGIVLALAEKLTSKEVARWIPSPSAMGLALVIPVYYSISFFIGGLLFLVAKRFAESWTGRFAIVLAAGIIAGESLAGVGDAILKVIDGLSGG
jgi:putative OPT family oligopeptide transporter